MAKNKAFGRISLLFLCCTFLGGCSLLGDADLKLCEDAVKGRLKAPATAQFSGFEQEELDARLTAVRGSVDSENGFGAMIRSSFKCHVLDDEEATVMYID
jgi:hypothetical protein